MEAPEDLGIEGSRLWADVTGRFDLDENSLSLLRQACRTADLCERLSRVADSEDLIVSRGTGAQAVHPAVVELRQQRLVLARLIQALDIPEDDDEEEDGPALSGRHKNQTRRPDGRFGGKKYGG